LHGRHDFTASRFGSFFRIGPGRTVFAAAQVDVRSGSRLKSRLEATWNDGNYDLVAHWTSQNTSTDPNITQVKVEYLEVVATR
jgi:hypothetical protein